MYNDEVLYSYHQPITVLVMLVVRVTAFDARAARGKPAACHRMGQLEKDRFRLVAYTTLGHRIDPRIPLSIVWMTLMGLLIVFLLLTPLTSIRLNPYDRLDQIFDHLQVPRENVPKHYEINLKVFLPYRPGVDYGKRNFTFDGFVKIIFRCETPNRKILLHSARQLGFRVQLFDDLGKEISLQDHYHNHSQELLHIQPADLLTAGVDYTLHINYTGGFDNGNFTGIYSAPYRHETEKRWMLATHLQSMDARTLFPCFDVPDAKAKFKATVEHPFGTNAVSNTIETIVVNNGNWTITAFKETPLMSTYLFALCVSDFPYTETHTLKGVRVRVYTEPSKVNDTGTALDIVPRLLDFYEDYFQYEYPLMKLDIYAVPVMRVAAMENWGLIICNQKHVVYNAEIYSVSERRQVTDLLSHEVAHQWFGNLVTMKWWNNLWLNEGFASMIGIKAADHSEGITVRMNEVSVDWNARVYRQDQTDRATPLTIPTGQIVDPERQFNLISYKKAAGLLRMIEFIVGEDIFRNGLRKYIKTHEYGNGDHEDLLRALSSVHDNSEARTHLSEQNFSLSNVVEKWIYQKGFPLVKVNKRGGEIDVWDVTQEHFQLYPSNSSLQWKIPLFARDRQTNTTTVQWLLEDSTVAIDLTDDLVLDREGRMYGRIQYDSWTYQRIIKALQEDHTVIPVSGRIRLLDDSFTFAEIGHLSYGDVFRLALYLRSEISYMPVLISGAHLEVFQSRFVTHPQNRVLQDYIQYLFIPLFHKFLAEPMSQDNVPIFQDNLREHVFMRVCLTGYKPCIDYTQKLFEKTRQQCNDAPLSSINCNVIPQFLRMPVYASAVLYGGDEAFEFLYRKWRAETYQMERDRIWSGMAASRKKEHIHRLFEDVLFEFGRREDFRHRCTDHGKFYPKENHFRSFVYENSERIAERFTRNDLILGYILVCFSRTIYEKDDLDLYQQVERRLKNASTRGIPESVSFIPKFIQALKFREHYEGMIFGNLTEVLNEGRMVNSGNDTKLERAYFESAVTTTEVNQVEEILENLVIDLSLINPKSSPFSSHPMMNDSINP